MRSITIDPNSPPLPEPPPERARLQALLRHALEIRREAKGNQLASVEREIKDLEKLLKE